VRGGGNESYLFELQLITYECSGALDGACRQFEHAVSAKAETDSVLAHVGTDLQDFFLLVQIQNVDRKLHSKAVDRLARGNPEAITLFQRRVFEEAAPTQLTGDGDSGVRG